MRLVVFLGLLLFCTPVLFAAGEFKVAKPGYSFSFPFDHQPHPGYKTEWWYYTGFLHDLDHKEKKYGFQFTIFKLERSQGTLYLFHCALSSPEKYYFNEVMGRDWPGSAGVHQGAIWVHHSHLLIQGKHHRLVSHCNGVDLTLDLSHQLAPVIHGKNGVSPKGRNPKNVSHYYSIVDLKGSGTLSYKGKHIQVRAESWMDHEFGSNFMAEDQKGWDWISFTLDSGERMMLYRIRQSSGGDFYWGSLISKTGQVQRVKDIQFRSTGVSRSKQGTRYPSGFEVTLPQGHFLIRPWYKDQEGVAPFAGMSYFEGPIDVVGQWHSLDTKGVGYLEMTGYSGKMKGKF